MNRAAKKRLQKVTEQIGALPLAPRVVDAAFLDFRETGELPEDCRLAVAVIRRAKHGAPVTDVHGRIDWAATIRTYVDRPARPDDAAMDELYDEAVFAEGMVRWAARLALKAFATVGFDVTEPVFAKRNIKLDLPDYGGVGLYLMGFPERLAKPPYEAQAERLFARYDLLRARINRTDREWFEALEESVRLFHELGELPDDEEMREAVLADAELRALFDHAGGEDVSELMAALDTVAQADRETKVAAISTVRHLVQAGVARP